MTLILKLATLVALVLVSVSLAMSIYAHVKPDTPASCDPTRALCLKPTLQLR